MVTAAACLLFAGYAASFLYFFVDDEAIPLVYARNLLRGRGLVYTALEGRVEGYSDFLHVIWSTLLLAVTRAAGQSLLAPLLVGKAVSFAAALAIIVVTARTLRRSQVSTPGMVTALAFLALSGPLAVWACSSLETVTFALLTTLFTSALLSGNVRIAWICGAAAVLLRIDGPIYALAIAASVAIAAPSARVTAWKAARAVVLVAAVYHGWRIWYFHSVLSAPLAAKVLFRLAAPANALVKLPEVPYLLAYVRVYGTPWAFVIVGAAAVAWRNRSARACAIALLVLGLYVQLVGDWMFGWRFVVALLPLLGVVLGCAVSRLPRAAGWAAALVLVAWSAVAVRTFDAAYVDSENKPLFYSDMSGGQALWLGRYYELIGASRQFLHAGDRVADNQAGLLPYLLDLENVDDLGICSKFVAELPTTDVYYTTVGRYSPLNNQPVLRTAQAYLLHQDVQFVITPTDLLTKANGGVVPPRILDDLFERVAIDASGANAIYRRTAKTADRYRRDPDSFTENVAHATRLIQASLDGHVVPSDRYGADLPFLREQSATRPVTGNMSLDLRFARRDERLDSLFVGLVSSRLPATMTVTVFNERGGATARLAIPLPAGDSSVFQPFAPGVSGVAVSVRIDVPPGEDRIAIADLRLLGQSSALRDYLRRLRFSAPAPGTH